MFADFRTLMRTAVLLLDNAWEGFSFDGKKEDWTRFTSSPPQGFNAVPAGRHRAVALVDGHPVTFDFILYPGDVVARRLDRAARAWLAADDSDPDDHDDALISYRTTMGIARVMASRPMRSPEAVFEEARAALASLVARGDGAAEAEAARAGEQLIGVPLVAAQLEELRELGRRAPRVGLAFLPGEPTLSRALSHRDS